MNQQHQATQSQTKSPNTFAVDDIRLWTALVTPMLPNGDVDFLSLEKNAQQQAAAGNGITLLGSTGEGLALTPDEQLSIVAFICELSLNVPIMVAVGGYNLPSQLAWIKQCNKLAISAYLFTSPIYVKPGVVGLTKWFSTLLDQAQHPCMIYNVPSRSGINIPIDVMKNIQHHQNCWAMKEASGDLNTFLAFTQHCPELAIYSGEDAMMPYLAGAGVKGLVSVAANVWPEATHRYVEMAITGAHQGLFPVWNNAVGALFQVASPIPVKVLMHLNNQLNYPTLRVPLTEFEITDDPIALKSLMAVDIEINQWLEKV
ncbi:4-hydroxy-tetrahydrodipicolinate synthase [Colwelliaceae bacterium 6441]